MPGLVFYRRGEEVLRVTLEHHRRLVLGQGERCDVVIPDPHGHWERQTIEEALRRCNHHRGRAAQLLGLSRSSFFERLKAWGDGHEGE
ncbi:MAG TPA: helix-turn-helix domain-containing protein [Myxococcaceae bacterium]|jgi:DNA-binding NtrC family response regulator